MPAAERARSRTAWSRRSGRSGTRTRPGWCSASACCWSRSRSRTAWCSARSTCRSRRCWSGLMLRGVAFELRIKAEGWHRELWNWLFWAGSTLAAFAQGLMLGRYITGFEPGVGYWLFALLVGASLCGGYVLLGATWLILRTDGPLQAKAVAWARWGLLWVALGVALVSLGTPLVERDGARQVVRLPAHARISCCCRSPRLRPGSGSGSGSKKLRLDAVRRRGRDLRARLRRPRLQPVSLRGDRPPDDLGGGGASERARSSCWSAPRSCCRSSPATRSIRTASSEEK